MPEAVLREVLDEPAGQFLRVVSAPDGLDIAITATVLHDVEEAVPDLPGAMLLVPGLRPDSLRARELIAAGAAAGIAAIVFKFRDADPDQVAQPAGLVILAAEDSAPWRQLDAAIATALAVRIDGPSSSLGDLFALAGAIAAMVGGAVAIEDTQMRVLAHSTLPDQPIDETRRQGILGRVVPVDPANEASYRAVYRAPGAILITLPPDRPRLAIAVRAAWEVLGSIWVVEGHREFSEADARALERAAALAASHLVLTQTGDTYDRRRRADILRDLLEGRSDPTAGLARLGIDAEARLAVLGFQASIDTGAGGPSSLDMITLLAETFRRDAVSAAIGRTVYSLVPFGLASVPSEPAAFGQDIIDTAERRQGLKLRAAIGTPKAGPAALTDGRAEVDRVLRVLADGRLRIATFADVQSAAITLELRDLLDDRPHLRLPLIEQLDWTAATTVLAYLDAFGNGSAAAEHLQLHPNTFRYRFRQACEQFALDLDDPDVRLMVWLQLRLRNR